MVVHDGLDRIKSWPGKLYGGTPQQTFKSPTKAATKYLEHHHPKLSGTPQKEEDSSPRNQTQRRASGEPSRTSFDSVREGSPTQSFIVTTKHQDGSISYFDGFTSEEAGLKKVMTTSALLPSPALSEWRAEVRLFSVPQRDGGTDVTVDEVHDDNDHHDCHDLSAKNAVNEQVNHVIASLPYEVLDQILGYLLLETPPSSSFTPRNADLLSCLLSCRGMHRATLNVLYRHVTIPHSRIFAKMFDVISSYPNLGRLVRRLDLSHYTVIGLGRTRKANSEIQNLTSQNLAQCLKLMPNLREFLVHEHIDDVLDEEVLKTLFSMPSIQAIDLCACSSQAFVRSFDTAVTNNPDLPHTLPNLERLSLHECQTLQAPAFERLLIRLPNLKHLEVSHTLITNRALTSIPESARLTHLNVNKCTRLSGEVVVDFLLNHPAAERLQYLGLMSDAARHQILDTEDLERLLPHLPSTLRSLNINGSNLTSVQLPLLLPLRTQLDELSIAQSNLSINDLNLLFRPQFPENASKYSQPSTLVYLDLTSIQSLTRSALFSPDNLLLTSQSLPLSVIELSDEALISQLRGRYSTPGNGLGWIVKESGRRSWLVRDRNDGDGVDGFDDGAYVPARPVGEDEESEDSAYRRWKWGAKWWGMRKVPVAWRESGGMYGHYAFRA